MRIAMFPNPFQAVTPRWTLLIDLGKSEDDCGANSADT